MLRDSLDLVDKLFLVEAEMTHKGVSRSRSRSRSKNMCRRMRRKISRNKCRSKNVK